VSDGAERAIREDHPRELPSVEARGGVPSTAHGTEAGAVGRQRKANKDEVEEIRQEIRPRRRGRRHRRDIWRRLVPCVLHSKVWIYRLQCGVGGQYL
jgi:hypothetical protein